MTRSSNPNKIIFTEVMRAAAMLWTNTITRGITGKKCWKLAIKSREGMVESRLLMKELIRVVNIPLCSLHPCLNHVLMDWAFTKAAGIPIVSNSEIVVIKAPHSNQTAKKYPEMLQINSLSQPATNWDSSSSEILIILPTDIDFIYYYKKYFIFILNQIIRIIALYI